MWRCQAKREGHSFMGYGDTEESAVQEALREVSRRLGRSVARYEVELVSREVRVAQKVKKKA